MTERRTVSLS